MKSNASPRGNGKPAGVHLALIHHPVMDKNGQTIAAAITSLDLHDIARIAKTYGVGGFHVVTPLVDQQELIRRITGHWVEGVGARYNPDRQAALELIRIQASVNETLAEIERIEKQRPLTVVTSAKMAHSDMSHGALRQTAQTGQPVVLMFGTAWGLAPELIASADYRLEPIYGSGDYNHLAVRSAVAIILDRMLGAPPAQM